MRKGGAILSYRDIEFSIVSGSDEEMVFACLESLSTAMRASAHLKWVATVTLGVDADNSTAKRIRQAFPHVRLLDRSSKSDASGGHNEVLRTSQARYVWLLDDNVVFLAGTVEMIVSYMDRPENSRVALVGPQLLNPDGVLARDGYAFPSMRRILLEQSGVHRFLMDKAPDDSIKDGASGSGRGQDVDTAPGACVAVRLKAIRQTGAMTDDAPARGAESEWHRRVRENGWRVVLLADASVMYYGIRASRQGHRQFHPEQLEGALYFFRTGRPLASFKIFCAALMAVSGGRALAGWITRDHIEASTARQFARRAWVGLLQS